MAHSNNHHDVKIIEQCRVSPPRGSLLSTTTLPLTFFDIPWLLLLCVPVKRVFFYDFPHPPKHFLESALPILKQSLSLTLQHFFPFSSNLIFPPHPQLPFIRYQQGTDSVSFTVAESQADFNLLVSNSPQDVRDWHPLIPSLPPYSKLADGSLVIPLAAIQVTVLPKAGFAISLTFIHIAADGKSLHHFTKFWATICKEMTSKREGLDDQNSIVEGAMFSLPFHGREKVKDTKGLMKIFLEDLGNSAWERVKYFQRPIPDLIPSNKVRATLVLTRGDIEKLKNYASLKFLSHMSTFVVTCSLFWVCIIESEQEESKDSSSDNSRLDEPCYLVFLADFRGSAEFSVPLNYFGNCLISASVGLKKGEIVGENGFTEVASAVEREIRDLKEDALKKAENMVRDYKEFGEASRCEIIVAGSPRLGVYETDFGWGKPKKSDTAHMDSSKIFSVSDSRHEQGAIELGFALERNRFNRFINIFQQRLSKVRAIFQCIV